MESLDYINYFNLKEEYFDHPSHIHGIRHTYRVMSHCIVLGDILNLRRDAKLAFCAAYIHDMSRKHDGRCSDHGPWAAEYKLPLFAPLFSSVGVSESEIQAIRTAVHWHSLQDEIDGDHEHYRIVAILKDADALDRVRLKPGLFDLNYLRFPESRGLVQYAEKLFKHTTEEANSIFSEYLFRAEQLLGNMLTGFRQRR